jgi:hypothetical protein
MLTEGNVSADKVSSRAQCQPEHSEGDHENDE